MDTSQLALDAFGRIRELYVDIASDLDLEVAHRRPDSDANSIVWLLWHTARVQDDHVAGLADATQAWHGGWAERFDLPFDGRDIGYGHSSADVAAVRVRRIEELVDYHAAVHELSTAYAAKAEPEELDRVVDESWDPPVTAGVRLVSVLSDCLQHLGQAGYVKGLLTT